MFIWFFFSFIMLGLCFFCCFFFYVGGIFWHVHFFCKKIYYIFLHFCLFVKISQLLFKINSTDKSVVFVGVAIIFVFYFLIPTMVSSH